MKTKDFSFELPAELIAQAPPETRGASRLMILDPAQHSREHARFQDFVEQVDPNTLLVFNDSRVRKARVFGILATGGKLEVIFLRRWDEHRWECLLNKSKRLKEGQVIHFPEGREGVIASSSGNVRTLTFAQGVEESWLDKYGHIPLPPYIRRPDNDADAERYQTVYAKEVGSAAAPTAGLHFTQAALERLRQRGVETATVTLHVGLGTFLPVRAEDIRDHEMHREFYRIEVETAERLNAAKRAGRPILAVGTTSLRTLEASWSGTEFRAGEDSTDIFIYPGYRFGAVDQLFTNFHTPESTLLMLVAAFGGWEFIRESYEEAVKEHYRFFSYGDAMWLKSRTAP